MDPKRLVGWVVLVWACGACGEREGALGGQIGNAGTPWDPPDPVRDGALVLAADLGAGGGFDLGDLPVVIEGTELEPIGASVATGDLDGDGLSELMVASAGPDDRARVRTWTGQQLAADDVTPAGVTSEVDFGPQYALPQVRVLPDLDGDGALEVGFSPMAVGGFLSEWTLLSAPQLAQAGAMDGASAAWQRFGYDDGGGVGDLAPCSVGDLDGDGVEDLVVDNYLGPRVFYGSDLVGPDPLELAFVPNPSLEGEARRHDRLGDLDGDGLAEIVVEIETRTGPRAFVWTQHVFSGALLHDPALLETPGTLTILADRDNPEARARVDALGDLDGDGVVDLGVAYGVDGAGGGVRVGWLSGAAVFDREEIVLQEIESVPIPLPYWNDGWDRDHPAGIADAVVADVDGDGLLDWVIASDLAFVVSGADLADPDWDGTPHAIVAGHAALGYDVVDRVASVGDLDGDGLDEILLAKTRSRRARTAWPDTGDLPERGGSCGCTTRALPSGAGLWGVAFLVGRRRRGLS